MWTHSGSRVGDAGTFTGGGPMRQRLAPASVPVVLPGGS